MGQIMRDVCADFGRNCWSLTGNPEHVYLAVNFPPMVAIFGLVNSLGGISSRRLRAESPRPAPPLLAGQTAVVGSNFA